MEIEAKLDGSASAAQMMHSSYIYWPLKREKECAHDRIDGVAYSIDVVSISGGVVPDFLCRSNDVGF